jgi:iron(III) transport system ATP-binding protein
MELIRLQDVEFGYGDRPVLRGVNLTIAENLVTVLVGPSGSGKSTVLRLIAGLEAPQRGSVFIDHEAVSLDGRVGQPPEARGVSMVFQDLALWPHMSAAETLAFVLGPGVPREHRRRRIEETLTAVGLDRRVDARPAQLSGGERQRLALARAIITRPRILLMDEPLANLDPPLRLALVDEIGNLRERFGLTILYVTHNQQETFAIGDHAAVLHGGQIEQTGTPRDLYERPRTTFVASFLGRCAILPGFLNAGIVETTLGAFPASGSTGARGPEVAVVIRPEDVVVGDDGKISGQVDRVTSRGADFEAEITGPGWRLWATMREEPKRAQMVRLSIHRVAIVPREGS